jgi:hypothetical protein
MYRIPTIIKVSDVSRESRGNIISLYIYPQLQIVELSVTETKTSIPVQVLMET